MLKEILENLYNEAEDKKHLAVITLKEISGKNVSKPPLKPEVDGFKVVEYSDKIGNSTGKMAIAIAVFDDRKSAMKAIDKVWDAKGDLYTKKFGMSLSTQDVYKIPTELKSRVSNSKLSIEDVYKKI